MPPSLEQITCPRFPEHGLATKWWLPPEEREMFTKGAGDVFAIKCQLCGEYEWRFEPAACETGHPR
jgi:hypothetical protein